MALHIAKLQKNPKIRKKKFFFRVLCDLLWRVCKRDPNNFNPAQKVFGAPVGLPIAPIANIIRKR
jgi:hypothetical protein